MLTDDMKRLITEQRLGFVATTNQDGSPNLSPKGTFIVLDDHVIAFGEIRSPNTIRNLLRNPAVEVNFVDPFVRKGCRFRGAATVIDRGHSDFDEALRFFAEFHDALSTIRAIVKIRIERALPLISPAYDREHTEPELRRLWTRRFRELQPGKQFAEG